MLKQKREHNQREAFDFSPRKENFFLLFSPDDGKVFTRFQLRKIVVFCSGENGEDVERGISLSGALFTTFYHSSWKSSSSCVLFVSGRREKKWRMQQGSRTFVVRFHWRSKSPSSTTSSENTRSPFELFCSSDDKVIRYGRLWKLSSEICFSSHLVFFLIWL